MKVKIALATSAALLLSGCATVIKAPYQIVTPFNVADYKPYEGAGNATLSGQAFLRTIGGDVKTCAGQDVILWPGTPYAQEMFSAVKKGYAGHFANADARFNAFWRTGICDAQGNFTFPNLPAGNWIVLADAIWGAPTGGGISRQGGAMIKQVKLQPGPNSVLLSEADLEP